MIKKKKIIIICTLLITVTLMTCLLIMCNGRKCEEIELPEDDFSQMTWTEAFKELNDTISKQYAFTEWKSIKWSELYNKYIQKIESAQEKDSFEEYYLAMLSYIGEIPDGHVSISHDAEIDNKYIGGFFGFNVTQLDNGKVIVTWIDPDGLAVDKGINIGDEITMWNDQPISSALEAVSTIFSGPSATSEVLKQKKLNYLVRAPINTEVSITLSDSRSFVLKAYNDQKKSLFNCYPYNIVSVEKISAILNMIGGNPNPNPELEGVVETKMLEDNILYTKIWGFFDLDTDNTGTPKSTMELMRKAVSYANENNCTDMILDVRNNIGGIDVMVADILGLFYSERTFYEYQKYSTCKDMPELYIDPEPQIFNGNIIVLVNSQCVSCGEGIAQFINNLDKGESLGFYGTNGSFGMAGAMINMPGEITIDYPYGQSLDENKNVQLDSQNGIGGVSPSIRIPMNKENALRIANGEDVELEEALRILRED